MKRKSPNKKIFPILMVALGSLLLLGSVIVFINIPPEETIIATPTQSTVSIPYSRVNRVSLIDAKAAYDLGNAKFIDTRGEPYYSEGHIPGALSITDTEILNKLDQFSPSDWIITYCT